MQWLILNVFFAGLALVGAGTFWALFSLVLALNLSSAGERWAGLGAFIVSVLLTGVVARWSINTVQRTLNRGT